MIEGLCQNLIYDFRVYDSFKDKTTTTVNFQGLNDGNGIKSKAQQIRQSLKNISIVLASEEETTGH